MEVLAYDDAILFNQQWHARPFCKIACFLYLANLNENTVFAHLKIATAPLAAPFTQRQPASVVYTE